MSKNAQSFQGNFQKASRSPGKIIASIVSFNNFVSLLCGLLSAYELAAKTDRSKRVQNKLVIQKTSILIL